MTNEERTRWESEARAVVTSRIEAIRTKNREATLAPYASDVVTFDVLPPLRNVGAKVIAQKLDGWFDGYEGSIGCELRDLAVTASADVAFAHGLCRFTGTLKAGAKVDMWVRLTVGLARRDGRFAITHEHMSDPLDPKTGQALMGLKPE